LYCSAFILVRLCVVAINTRKRKQLKEGKISFGSQLHMVQTMVGWFNGLGQDIMAMGEYEKGACSWQRGSREKGRD
jgi:hypothetical protein